MKPQETPLAAARRHIEVADARIAQQIECIARLRGLGLPTEQAEHLLVLMRQSREAMAWHLGVLSKSTLE